MALFPYTEGNLSQQSRFVLLQQRYVFIQLDRSIQTNKLCFITKMRCSDAPQAMFPNKAALLSYKSTLFRYTVGDATQQSVFVSERGSVSG
jgi:hypothetical protein